MKNIINQDFLNFLEVGPQNALTKMVKPWVKSVTNKDTLWIGGLQKDTDAQKTVDDAFRLLSEKGLLNIEGTPAQELAKSSHSVSNTLATSPKKDIDDASNTSKDNASESRLRPGQLVNFLGLAKIFRGQRIYVQFLRFDD